VDITQYTEKAHFGFGTVSNNFPTKEAIYEALVEEVVDQFADALDRLGELVPDPAEKVAASIRYTLQRGRQDPTWGRFVVRTGFASEGISHGLGKYLLRDLSTGLAMKRFRSDDLPMTFVAVGSTVLGALAAEVEMQDPIQPGRETLATLLQGSAQIPERIALILLTLLGLDLAEAKEIANRPLPPLSSGTLKAAPIPSSDPHRLQALRELWILDTPAEERFDKIVNFAASEFDVPIALISLVDENRQWFKAKVGLDTCETSRDISFCGHALESPDFLVIEDPLTDERFSDNPQVTGAPFVRFYAGAPLALPSGHVVGTLCLIDQRPRTLDPMELSILGALRDLVMAELAGDPHAP